MHRNVRPDPKPVLVSEVAELGAAQGFPRPPPDSKLSMVTHQFLACEKQPMLRAIWAIRTIINAAISTWLNRNSMGDLYAKSKYEHAR